MNVRRRSLRTGLKIRSYVKGDLVWRYLLKVAKTCKPWEGPLTVLDVLGDQVLLEIPARRPGGKT